MDMFYQEEVSSEEHGVGYLRNRPAQTYDEVVKDLILKEKSYLRDLNMITKVNINLQLKRTVLPIKMWIMQRCVFSRKIISPPSFFPQNICILLCFYCWIRKNMGVIKRMHKVYFYVKLCIPSSLKKIKNYLRGDSKKYSLLVYLMFLASPIALKSNLLNVC